MHGFDYYINPTYYKQLYFTKADYYANPIKEGTLRIAARLSCARPYSKQKIQHIWHWGTPAVGTAPNHTFLESSFHEQ